MTRSKKSDNLKQRVAGSVIAQIASQLVMGLLGVVILKIMTNNLGTTSYGTYVTILAFVSTFSLLTDLGLNSITAREVAKFPDKAAEIIGHNLGLRIALSLIMIPAIFGLSFIFYPDANNNLRFGILFMSTYLFFDVVWAASSSYFSAKVRSDITAKYTVIQQVLFLLSVIAVAVVGWGLFGFITAYVGSIAVGALLILLKVRSHIPLYPQMNLGIWRKVIKASIAVGLISIINAMYLKADSVMISIIKGAADVGVYGVAYLLVNIFSALPGYIMGALTPSMARAKPDELQQIVQKAFHYMVVFACVIVVGSFLARKNIVLVVSSQEYLGAATPFAILIVGTAFSYVSNVFSYASVAINKHHKFVFASLATLLFNIGINFILIPRYGIIGAAWATLASECISMVIRYFLFHRETGLILNPLVIIKPITAALISFGIGWLLLNLLQVNSAFLNCLLILVVVTAPYLAILYLTNGLPTEMKAAVAKGLARLPFYQTKS